MQTIQIFKINLIIAFVILLSFTIKAQNRFYKTYIPYNYSEDCIGQNSKLKQQIFILSDTSYISLVFQNFKEGNRSTERDFIYFFGEQTRVHTIINSNNYRNIDTTFTLNTIQLNTVQTIYRGLLNKDIKCDSMIFAGDWVSYLLSFNNIKINGTFKGSFSLFDKINLLR